MHVSFQGSRIVVSWRTVKITEREEPIDNDTGATRILRELEHKKYSRTIPLPENTRVRYLFLRLDVALNFFACSSNRSVLLEMADILF